MPVEVEAVMIGAVGTRGGGKEGDGPFLNLDGRWKIGCVGKGGCVGVEEFGGRRVGSEEHGAVGVVDGFGGRSGGPVGGGENPGDVGEDVGPVRVGRDEAAEEV